MVGAGQRYTTRELIIVQCIWWYDTAAILADYSDACEATLPAGEPFTIREVGEGPVEGRVLCDLDRAEVLKEHLIPKGRQIKNLWCRPTPYCIEMSESDLNSKCKLIE